MFDSDPSAKQFLRALSKLQEATKNSKPATMNNSVARILKAASGFEGSKLDELIQHIASPPKRAAKVSGRKSAKSTLKPHSKALVAEIISVLEKVVDDPPTYEARVQAYAKSCGAKTLKIAAAEFAAAPEPKSKAYAVDLLLSERANRVRTNKKIAESSKASPW